VFFERSLKIIIMIIISKVLYLNFIFIKNNGEEKLEFTRRDIIVIYFWPKFTGTLPFCWEFNQLLNSSQVPNAPTHPKGRHTQRSFSEIARSCV
jgi:hypothetical protein